MNNRSKLWTMSCDSRLKLDSNTSSVNPSPTVWSPVGKIILLSSQMPQSSPCSYCRINRDLSFLLKRETGESASERRPRSPSIQWVGGDLTRDDGLSEAAVFNCGSVDRIRTERVRPRLERRQDGREGDAAARQKGIERRRTTDREGATHADRSLICREGHAPAPQPRCPSQHGTPFLFPSHQPAPSLSHPLWSVWPSAIYPKAESGSEWYYLMLMALSCTACPRVPRACEM